MGGVELLLDTHALLWWWSDPGRLAARVDSLLRDPANIIHVSAASAWEIATKHRIGKFPDGGRIVAQWEERIASDRFFELPMTFRHALRAGSLPGDHRDPFDRMLAAQSIIEGLSVVSIDEQISALGAERVWE
ncbi:MAG: type II toxin-antitoxin system VapC family toxin [Spirochaetaceae bacterium]|nr:MAG: type II toxin-antitoxin system VapC family toxin [Spirochaetaceae bacterium]